MSAPAGISIEEYLHTSYENPDREYRDGEIIERSMPDRAHAATQMLLGAIFLALRPKFLLHVYSEFRMRIRAGLVRIPDVAVYWNHQPAKVADTPPFIAVEILSDDDRMIEVRSKLAEYRDWGVRHVWLIDPHARTMYTFEGKLQEVSSLAVPEFDLEIQPASIFEP